VATLHQGQPIESAGKPLLEAAGAVVLLHGEGDSAEAILSLVDRLGMAQFAYLAPEATDGQWFPHSLLAPLEDNEPWFSSALAAVDDVLDLVQRAGVTSDRVVLLGFSQGACVALEYVARNPKRYGAVVGLSGALIGPDGINREYSGRLELYAGGELIGRTEVFLGAGGADPDISSTRVEETGALLRDMGAEVTERIYPDLGHAINDDEVQFVRGMLSGIAEYSQ